jgi:succinate-semialdehyde dehydrogenase / glutarate-semialdehyde dehydrogenase
MNENLPLAVANPDANKTSQLLKRIPTGLLIGDEFTAGSGEEFEVFDPANGEVLTKVANASEADLHRALDLAAQAQPAWAKTAPRQRAEVLRKAFELMIEQADDIALIMSLENGKTLADAKAETLYAAEFFRWFSEEAVRIDGSFRTAPSGLNKIITLRQPVGIAFLITPWNFPAAMFTRKVGPAIAAGAAAILKPAQETPLTALLIGKILLQAGLPSGICGILPTTNSSSLTKAALADQRIRKLSFTGSTQVGKLLMQQAADRVLNTSMELGGNAPFIVLDDADIDLAVEGAMLAKMRNGGQACTAANRFFVQDAVHDLFVEKLSARMTALKPGHGTAAETTLAPLVNRKAVLAIAQLVDTAIKNGAKQFSGGSINDGPGSFFPATVLGDVPAKSQIVQDEIFGPVAAVVRVKDEFEALELANQSEYGLAGYVYTQDVARGLRVCQDLAVGMVGLNRGLVSDPAAPFGGVKQSGIGREGGYEGIDEYLEVKYIATSDF